MALSIRMVLITVVALYTSRAILEALGVDDYGIYGVIGTVVTMASFLNNSMAGATSRFITFELGRNDEEKVKSIFSTSLLIHLLIALGVAVLAETVGLWFVNTQMKFPPERMTAVNVLYQFTILTMVVNFTQVPYTAVIIAREKMNIYAYIEIVNVVLKLAAVYIVLIFKTDKLILYGILVFCITATVAMIYRIYCMKHFPEAKSGLKYDKPLMKKMMAFSGFDLYGNMCGTLRYQGQPVIINLFFGVVANVASTITSLVTASVRGLTSSISQAFRPQIIKQYAVENVQEMSRIMLKANQFTLLAFALVGIPVFIEVPAILNIWLGQIPEYAVVFLRLALISAFIEICIEINHVGIHATGFIKYMSFFNGTFYLLCPVVSYIILRYFGMPASATYVVNIIFMTVIALLGMLFLKIQIPQFSLKIYGFGILRVVVAVVLAMLTLLGMRHYGLIGNYQEGLWNQLKDIILVVLLTFGILGITGFFIGFNSKERRSLLEQMGKVINRFTKREIRG